MMTSMDLISFHHKSRLVSCWLLSYRVLCIDVKFETGASALLIFILISYKNKLHPHNHDDTYISRLKNLNEYRYVKGYTGTLYKYDFFLSLASLVGKIKDLFIPSPSKKNIEMILIFLFSCQK